MPRVEPSNRKAARHGARIDGNDDGEHRAVRPSSLSPPGAATSTSGCWLGSWRWARWSARCAPDNAPYASQPLIVPALARMQG
jgi:hypothetical protein